MAINRSYQPNNIVYFCRERSRVLAYCCGRLRGDLTVRAQRHIARCPDCFALAMRTLDTMERRPTDYPAPAELNIVDVEWTPIPLPDDRSTSSLLLWIFVLALLATSLGMFIAMLNKYLL